MGDTALPPVRIVADVRERGGLAHELARRADVALSRGRLTVGDYLIEGRITVERKSCPDLLQSLKSGHLFLQAARLKRQGERPFLLVEGIDLGAFVTDPQVPGVLGAITSLSVCWYLPVLWARDAAEAARLLVYAGRQIVRDRRESWPPTRPPPPDVTGLLRTRMAVLLALPGIGPGLARRLLDRFGSPAAIAAASARDLDEVPGVGPVRARTIRDTLGGTPGP